MAGEFDKHIVRVSFGGKNLGKSDNVAQGWAAFARRFKKPVQTREKHSRYRAESIEEKNRLKGIGGWFLGAQVKDGRRKAMNVKPRDIITLDLDNISVEEYESLVVHKNHYLNQFECFVHTTRSHRPEEPRVRVCLLADSEISVEKYEALTRIMAWHVDERMETVDPVSFRIAQMMYMPTISSDQEYLFGRNHGKLVDVNGLLESWKHDWTDMGQLPRAEREEKAREREISAEDPTEKRGLIGAFCRAYGIEDAIATFIPDAYGDVDPNSTEVRYTYLGGHSMYGAVIYEDKFMYSWHGTDPACEQLCNAWDLVRLHLFHEKDHKKDADAEINDLPSQKAMIDLMKTDKGVQKQIIEDELDFDAMFEDLGDLPEDHGHEETDSDDFGIEDAETRDLIGLPPKKSALDGLPDFPGRGKPTKTKKKWYDGLEIAPNGQIKPTTRNLLLILIHDPRFRGLMARNAFTHNIVLTRPMVIQVPEIPRFKVKDTINGDLWSDTHDAAVKAILSAPRGDGQVGYGIQAPDNALQEAIRLAAEQFAFHPLIDRFLALPEWDGVERVSGLWIDYMGVHDNAYHRESAELFMTAAIARVFIPGIAWDYVPILMGKENARKSTFVNDLAWGMWGGELSADLHNQQLAVEQMMSKWMMELAEVTNVKRSEAEVFKAFITRRDETVRLSYDRRAKDFPRQSVFVGTTNEHTFATSFQNRRMWPIKLVVNVIDNDKLRRELDQLWAEALVGFKRRLAAVGGDTTKLFFGLSPQATTEARLLQDSIRVESSEDTDIPAILEFLDKPAPVSAILNGSDFDDLTDRDEPMGLRTSTNIEQLVIEALGEEIPTHGGAETRKRKVSSAIRSLDEWESYEDWSSRNGTGGHSLKVGPYRKLRAFVRKDATKQEILDGFMALETEEEDLM